MPPFSAKAALADLDGRLKRAGVPARAKADAAYLKSDLEFYGVSLPKIDKISRAYVKEHYEIDRVALRQLALAAYKTGNHDHRTIALAVISRKKKLLEDRDLPWLLDLVDMSNTWAHVDWLATGLIGDVYARYPASRRWLPKWAKQKNFWIRRTAILAMLPELKRGGGDWRMWTAMADPMLGEKEFFIRKSIGWVLREVSKKYPKQVFEYIRPRRERMSGLTLREGAKYLSDSQRRALGLAPWRDREGRPFR